MKSSPEHLSKRLRQRSLILAWVTFGLFLWPVVAFGMMLMVYGDTVSSRSNYCLPAGQESWIEYSFDPTEHCEVNLLYALLVALPWATFLFVVTYMVVKIIAALLPSRTHS